MLNYGNNTAVSWRVPYTPQGVKAGCSSVLSHDMDEPVKSVICDARPMRRQTYDYLSNRRELLSFGRYQTTLFDDRA